MSGGQTSPAIYLVVRVPAGGAQTDAVAAALDLTRASSLLLEPAPGGVLDASQCRPLIELAQARGVAAVISGDAELARVLKADGVHLPWSKEPHAAYAAARQFLGARAIVGADAGRSRHDAMTLAEAGADYIAFGIPEHVEDRDTARERQVDLVAWWSELFEVPCVAADVEDATAAGELAAAGADFIAFRADMTAGQAAMRDRLQALMAAMQSLTEVDP